MRAVIESTELKDLFVAFAPLLTAFAALVAAVKGGSAGKARKEAATGHVAPPPPTVPGLAGASAEMLADLHAIRRDIRGLQADLENAARDRSSMVRMLGEVSARVDTIWRRIVEGRA